MQVTSGELLLLDLIPLPTCHLNVSTSTLLQITRRDAWLLTVTPEAGTWMRSSTQTRTHRARPTSGKSEKLMGKGCGKLLRFCVRLGHFILGIDQFDGEFFGLSEMEQRGMVGIRGTRKRRQSCNAVAHQDPHQWLTLEITYDSMFAAGRFARSLIRGFCQFGIACVRRDRHCKV